MASQAPAPTSNNADVFIPTRKVREPPGEIMSYGRYNEEALIHVLVQEEVL